MGKQRNRGIDGALTTLSTSMPALNINQKIFQRVKREPAAAGKSWGASKPAPTAWQPGAAPCCHDILMEKRSNLHLFPSIFFFPQLLYPFAAGSSHLRDGGGAAHEVARLPSAGRDEVTTCSHAPASRDGRIERGAVAGTDASPRVFHLFSL